MTQLQRAEEAVRASEERLRVLLESAPDAILLYDDRKDRFVEANRAAEALFECGRDELLERGARAFYSAIQPGGTDLVASFREHTARALAGEPVKFERLITTAKGNERLIEVQLALLPTADGFVIRSSFLDVTKSRQTEVALRRFNRALATLSASNAALVRATSERDLLQAMCEVAVGVGGYRMAWIGFAEHDAAKTVRPAAMAGHGTDFLKNADIRWADTGRGQGPAGRAIRTRTLIVNRNYEDNPAVAPWRDEATKRGFRSSVAVPLLDDGAAFGAFALYSGEADAFDDDEVTLLAELGADISYGIVALRDRAARDAAQIRLRDSMRETVASLAGMIELRDPYTAGHQRNVSSLAVAIARQMALPETEIGGVAVAGLVLDIGKIQTPAEFLSKPGRLTPTEFATIQMHPQAGYDILKRIRFPWPVAEMVLQHHERLDGSGYPNELHAPDILLGAKILAVADVVEAMTFHRPYRPAYGIESALAEIAAGKGRLYERSAVEACEKVFEDGFAFPPPEGDRPRT